MRIATRTICILLALGVAITILAVDAWILSRPEELRARAHEVLRSLLQPKAEVAIGSAEVVFPNRLILREVELREANSPAPTLQVERMELEVALPLLRPRRVEIHAPALRLDIDASGAIRVPALLRENLSDQREDSDGSPYAISVMVSGGSVLLRQQGWDNSFDHELIVDEVAGYAGPYGALHLEAVLRYDLAEGPITVDLTGSERGRLTLAASARGMKVDARLLDRLPPWLRQEIEPLNLSAVADVDVQLERPAPKPDAPTAGDSDSLLANGRVELHQLRVDVPLDADASAAPGGLAAAPKWPLGPLDVLVTFDPGGVVLEKLSGRCGTGATAKLDARASVLFSAAVQEAAARTGGILPPPREGEPAWPPPGGATGTCFFAHATLRDVVLDEAIRQALPYETRKDWLDFGIDGIMDAEITAFARPGEEGIHRFVRLIPRGRAHAYPRVFPLHMKRFTGYIEIQDETKYFRELRGELGGGGSIEINGGILGLNWIKRAKLTIKDASFTEDLFNALEPDESRIARAFHPSGHISATVEINQNPGEPIRPFTRVALAGAHGNFEDFAWPFEIAEGHLEVSEGAINVLQVVGLGRSGPDGQLDGMQFRASGHLVTKTQVAAGAMAGLSLGAAGQEFGFGPSVDLRVDVSNLPLGTQLLTGLGPEAARTIAQFAPAGKLRGTILIQKQAPEAQVRVTVMLEPQDGVVSMVPDGLGLPLNWTSEPLRVEVALDPRRPARRSVRVVLDGLRLKLGAHARMAGALSGGISPVAVSLVRRARLEARPASAPLVAGDVELLASGTIVTRSKPAPAAENGSTGAATATDRTEVAVTVTCQRLPVGPTLVSTLPAPARDALAPLAPRGPAAVVVRIRQTGDDPREIETTVTPLGASIATDGLGFEGDLATALQGRRLTDLRGRVHTRSNGQVVVEHIEGRLPPEGTAVAVTGKLFAEPIAPGQERARFAIGLRGLPTALALQSLDAEQRTRVEQLYRPEGSLAADLTVRIRRARPAGTDAARGASASISGGPAAGGVARHGKLSRQQPRVETRGLIRAESLSLAIDLGSQDGTRLVLEEPTGHLEIGPSGLLDLSLEAEGPSGETLTVSRVDRQPHGPLDHLALKLNAEGIPAVGPTTAALSAGLRDMLAASPPEARLSVQAHLIPDMGGRTLASGEVWLAGATLDVGAVLQDVTGPVRATLVWEEDGSLRMNGAMDGLTCKLSGGRIPATGLRADLALNQGLLSVDNIRSSLLGGRLRGEFNANLNDSPTAYAGKLSLERARLAELKRGARGKLSAEVRVEGRGGIGGTGELHLIDAELAKFPGWINVLRVLTLSPVARGTSTMDMLTSPWDTFREVHVTYEVTPEGIAIEEAQFLSSGLTLYATSGLVGWDGQLEDVRLFVPLGGRIPIPLLGDVLELIQKKFIFEVVVNGPMDDPNVEANPVSIISEPVRRAIDIFTRQSKPSDRPDGDEGP